MLEARYGCNSIVSLQLETDAICLELRRTVTRDEVFVLCRVVSWKLVLLMCRTKQMGESGLYILVPSNEDAYLALYNYAASFAMLEAGGGVGTNHSYLTTNQQELAWVDLLLRCIPGDRMAKNDFEGFAGLSKTAWLGIIASFLALALIGILAVSVDWENIDAFQTDWTPKAAELEEATRAGEWTKAEALAKQLRQHCPDECRGALDAYRDALVEKNSEKGQALYDTSSAATQTASEKCPDATASKYFNKSDEMLPIAKTKADYETMIKCAGQDDAECVKRLTWFYLKPCENFTVQTQGVTSVEIRHSSGKTGFMPGDYVGSR